MAEKYPIVYMYHIFFIYSRCRLCKCIPLAWLPDTSPPPHGNLLHIPGSLVQTPLLCKALPERGPVTASAPPLASHASLAHTWCRGGIRGASTWQQHQVTHLWRLHEVSHIPQPVPQLLDLGYRNPFEFGDDRNLGVQVLLLVAFFGEEGPPEEATGSMVCPWHTADLGSPAQSLPPYPPGSQASIRGPHLLPTSFPTPNTLHRPEAPAMHRRASTLTRHPWAWRCPPPPPSSANPLPLPRLDPASSLKTTPTQLKLVVSTGGLSASALTSVRDYLLPARGLLRRDGGPSCSVPKPNMGLGTRHRKGCRWAPKHTTCSYTPLASRQMESLPSAHFLPCSTTTSPAPEESDPHPSAQQDQP